MDFELNDEQQAYIASARAFSDKELAPHAALWDAESIFAKDALRAAGELGFMGMYTPEAAGGLGMGRLDASLIVEELAKGCTTTAAFLTIHNMATAMIGKYCQQSVIDEWCPDLVMGRKLASYCLTEPGSGSDAAALKTKAHKSNTDYTLTGTKAFISGGGYSDAYIIMARTGDDSPKGITALIVEDGAEGLSFGGLEDKMGWRAQPTRQVQLDECKTPIENLLGDEGLGFSYAMAGLDGGRLNIAACSLGAAQQAFDATRAYMAERKAFGKSINQFQALQFRLADMEIELQSGRIFLRQAAWKLDNGAPDATHFCAMAKKLVTDMGSKVANDCLQLHGGYGYLADYGIEKTVRDLRVHQILEGTNEIMRMIVARGLRA